jgi:hypothetical protein
MRLALKAVMQNDGDFIAVILLYNVLVSVMILLSLENLLKRRSRSASCACLLREHYSYRRLKRAACRQTSHRQIYRDHGL